MSKRTPPTANFETGWQPVAREINTEDLSPEPEPAPRPFMKGTFSVYNTPDGGYHIAYRLDGEKETQHAEIPGAALKMAQTLSGAKNPMAILGKLMGGK